MGMQIVAFREEKPIFSLDPGIHERMIEKTHSLIRIYPFNPDVGDEGEFKGWMLNFDSEEDYQAFDMKKGVALIELQLHLRLMPANVPVAVDPETGHIEDSRVRTNRSVIFTKELEAKIQAEDEARQEALAADQALVTWADGHGVTESELDELVHLVKGEEARDINNGGRISQLAYLLQYGLTKEKILEEIGLDHAGTTPGL